MRSAGGRVRRWQWRNDRSTSDCGVTFIEMLISIVLIGTVVVAVITAAQVTIISSRVERDHAKSQQWLQASIGVLQEDSTAFGECVVSPTQAELDAIVASYETAIRSGTTRPKGFDSDTQVTVTSVEVWDGVSWEPFVAQPNCLDNNQLRQQLVGIRVENNDGTIDESVEVVKHG